MKHKSIFPPPPQIRRLFHKRDDYKNPRFSSSMNANLIRIFFTLQQAMETQSGSTEREQRYSSTLSLTSTLYASGCLTPRPGHFTSGKKTRYPLYRRLGGPQDPSGRVWKISPPPEFDLRTVQPVPSSHSSIKVRCNGDSFWAGKSSWQVDYRLSDRQQDGEVARSWTRGRAIRVSE
jgi:hypothetical protein